MEQVKYLLTILCFRWYENYLKTHNYEDLIFPTDEVFKDDSKLFYHIPTPVKEHSPVYFMNLGDLLES